MPRIFAERRKTGELDIEAVELALRSALHTAGVAGRTEFLREPGSIQTYSCGGKTRYTDQRLRPILTMLGSAKILHACSWRSRCRQAQFPADAARDMMALIGSDYASFDHGRVTETIGANIAGRRYESMFHKMVERHTARRQVSPMLVGRKLDAAVASERFQCFDFDQRGLTISA